jgi:hypothetical protein
MHSSNDFLLDNGLAELANIDLIDFGQDGQRLMQIGREFEAHVFAFEHGGLERKAPRSREAGGVKAHLIVSTGGNRGDGGHLRGLRALGLARLDEHIRPDGLQIHESGLGDLALITLVVLADPLGNRLRETLAEPCHRSCPAEARNDFV